MCAEKVNLPQRRIFECTSTSFQSGCYYNNELESKVYTVVHRIMAKKAILFFDEINSAIRAGACSESDPRTLAALLDPFLASRDLSMIGATTAAGYDAMLRQNASFTNKFIKLEIPPMSADETLRMLSSLKREFEKKYKFEINNGCLEAVIDLCDRWLADRCFPGKAFEVLREVYAGCAVAENGAALSEAREQRKAMVGCAKAQARVTNQDSVYEVFKRRTGLPECIIHRDRLLRRDDLVKHFCNRILGQREAVESIVSTILSLKAELNPPNRPVAVYLCAGPTGVGKTSLARLLANYLFGSPEKLLRYDMSEFANYESISRLIGGSYRPNDHGRLVADVMASPFSVILFDEIEKAHPNIFNLLLPVLGEGRLTDSQGRMASFCNTIIIMTSNIGADLYARVPVGFKADTSNEFRATERDLLRRLEQHFQPEFINRITKVILFQPLSRDVIESIARREIESMAERRGVRCRSATMLVSDRVVELLVDKGYSPAYGARPMQRAVQDYVGYPLAVAISSGYISYGDEILIDLNKGGNVHIAKNNRIAKIR